jgi:mono/diheme cytochrome c family protein
MALTGILLVAVSGMALMGQAGTASQEAGKAVKKAPATHGNPESGAQMWKDYCAVCHGATGAGDGPAAEILQSPPADLSLMAKRNNGKFPAEHFASVLRVGIGGPVHGTSDMPFWGPLFRSHTDRRIRNLSAFVESLQQK